MASIFRTLPSTRTRAFRVATESRSPVSMTQAAESRSMETDRTAARSASESGTSSTESRKLSSFSSNQSLAAGETDGRPSK